jgi:preprotein translocase subunit Sec61beta
MADEKTTNPPAPAAPDPAADRAQRIPVYEEYDKAKWTLPPAKIVGIALAIVAVVVAIVVFLQRPVPTSSGSIDDVQVVEPAGGGVLVAINLTVHNVGQKPFYVHMIHATVKTDKGDFSDDAASAVDYDRYYSAYATLKQNAIPPIKAEDKIRVGGEQKGRIIVSFPTTKDEFDHRKSLTVTVDAYDQRPLVITK